MTAISSSLFRRTILLAVITAFTSSVFVASTKAQDQPDASATKKEPSCEARRGQSFKGDQKSFCLIVKSPSISAILLSPNYFDIVSEEDKQAKELAGLMTVQTIAGDMAIEPEDPARVMAMKDTIDLLCKKSHCKKVKIKDISGPGSAMRRSEVFQLIADDAQDAIDAQRYSIDPHSARRIRKIYDELLILFPFFSHQG